MCGTSGTVLLTDGTGRPLTAGLMYDDGRATAEAALARERGLRVQPTWALPKVMWLLREQPAGEAVRLTHQADFVVARLTGRPTATDSSHALKTGYDLTADAWPHERLAGLGLPESLFPEVVRPGGRLGEVGADGEAATGVPAGTPVIAGMTDGCAAQIASGSLSVGSWNSVLGTTLVLKGVTDRPVHDSTGVVYNHRAPDGGWLPGGASGVGAGALAGAFPDADPAHLDALAHRYEPSHGLAYPWSRAASGSPSSPPTPAPSCWASPGPTPTTGRRSSRESATPNGSAWTTWTISAPRRTARSPSPAAARAARTGTSCAPTSSAGPCTSPGTANPPSGWPSSPRTARAPPPPSLPPPRAWSASAMSCAPTRRAPRASWSRT